MSEEQQPQEKSNLFPDQVSQEQTSQPENVISDYYDGMKKMEMEGYESGIKKARNALFVTAGLFLFWEIIALARYPGPVPSLTYLIIAVEVGTFIALGLWTKTKPYTAIVVGLVVFVLLWIAAIALAGGQAVYSGIIVRVIILVNLISALKPAKAWEDLKKG